MGVPNSYAQAYHTLGDLQALEYWSNNRSEQSHLSTWEYLFKKVEAFSGKNVAEDLEKEVNQHGV